MKSGSGEVGRERESRLRGQVGRAASYQAGKWAWRQGGKWSSGRGHAARRPTASRPACRSGPTDPVRLLLPGPSKSRASGSGFWATLICEMGGNAEAGEFTPPRGTGAEHDPLPSQPRPPDRLAKPQIRTRAIRQSVCEKGARLAMAGRPRNRLVRNGAHITKPVGALDARPSRLEHLPPCRPAYLPTCRPAHLPAQSIHARAPLPHFPTSCRG
jgi:hypothetical protein